MRFCNSIVLLLFLLGLVFLGASCSDSSSTRGRAVILISLDTLRPDHLGCYGYKRNTSPNIDSFARDDAVMFKSAYAQSPYTLTSHMCMLTGLYPEAHMVLQPNFSDKGKTQYLKEDIVTLAEAFKEEGYITSAFTDGLLVDHKYGFDQGFDEYRDMRKTGAHLNGFRKFGKDLLDWIKDNKNKDFFLFVHTYDTHAPYVPPEPFLSQFKDQAPARELPSASMLYCSYLNLHSGIQIPKYRRLQDVIDAYDGGVAYVDSEMGKLFNHLKDLDLWEEALIVVTSDHGEAFMENRLQIGHGLFLNNEETLVPLIMKFPNALHKGVNVDQVVESIDIMPHHRHTHL